MSSRLMMLDALAGQTCARPPFWLMRQAGRYLPEYRKIRAEVSGFLELCFDPARAVEVTLQPLRRFDMDAAILFSDILTLPHALGQSVKFLEGEGPKLEPIGSAADLGKLKACQVLSALEPVYETVRRLRQALGQDKALIGFAGGPWTVACYMVEGGASKEFMAVKGWSYTDPAGFDALIQLLIETTADHLCAQIQAGADVVQLFDSWAGALAPAQFDRWVTTPTRSIVARVKARYPQVPIIGFPRQAGINLLDYVHASCVDTVGLDTAVPAGWAAANIQPRLPVQGNLDPAVLMAGGQALRIATDEILQKLANGPFIFNLGHGIHQHTPPDHVTQLAQQIRSWSNG